MRKINIKPLTHQEEAILKRILHTNKTIAEDLNISPKTVNTHIDNIYKKLVVNSRSQAVIEAIRQGIITADEFIY